MKLFLLASFIGACAAGALNSAYLPPLHGSNNRGQVEAYSQSSGVESSRPRAALDRSAAILKLESEVTDQGFHYAFETENGIQAQETAQESDGVQAQGGYSYTGDDGQVYSISYAAGAGGFEARGAHLPTAPPVPEEILKALEQNARDEAAGIFDDGIYREAKYAGESQPQAFSQQANSFSAPARSYLTPKSGSRTQSGYQY